MNSSKSFRYSDDRLIRVDKNGALTFWQGLAANPWSTTQKADAIKIVRTCVLRKERGIETVTARFAFNACAPTARAVRSTNDEEDERHLAFFIYRLLRSNIEVHIPVETLTL